MSYIFINALGISELLSRILAACGSVDYLIFACLAYFVIERYGRRKVMMCSAFACSICWIVIAIATGLSEKGGNSYVLGSVAVAFFFVSTAEHTYCDFSHLRWQVFFASFGMGVLGVPWLYPTGAFVPSCGSNFLADWFPQKLMPSRCEPKVQALQWPQTG